MAGGGGLESSGQPGGQVLPSGTTGGPTHPERFPADQGEPDMNNLMAGLRQLG